MDALDEQRRKLLLRLLTIFSIAILLTAASCSRVIAQGAEDGFSQLTPLAQQIAVAVNQARAQAGLSPLRVHPLLNLAAQAHVDDMLAHYTYGHWGTDGTLVRDRVARTGYAVNPSVSENWVSSSSADGAMRWWMNDYIHRVNILNPRWVEIGIGAGARAELGEVIFVTVFAAGSSGEGARVTAPAPAPSPSVPVVADIPEGGISYTVRPGDVLVAIAQRYGLAWEVLAAANGLADVTLLQIGEVIRLPGVVAEPAAEVVVAPLMAATGIGGPGEPVRRDAEPYTVQTGDTLFGVAARMGLTWQELAQFNGLSEGSLLQIGQVVWVPKQTDPASVQVDANPTEAGSAALAVEPVLYVVQAGDTLSGIALEHGVDWQSLLAINGLSESSVLQLGQALRLR